MACEVPAVRVYEPVITDDQWQAVRDTMADRKGLTGRRGRTVPNLFTHHVFCETCGAPLRIDTGGKPLSDGRRRKVLICSRFAENETCTDRRRFDLHHYERRLLLAIMRLTQVVPRNRNGSTTETEAALTATRAAIEQDTAMLNFLLPRAASSPTIAVQYDALTAKLDTAKRRAAELAFAISTAASSTSRWEDAQRFIRDSISPVLQGDIPARDRLRGLLARLTYRIEGRGPGMVVLGDDGQVVDIDPPGHGEDEDPD